jgi:hypothetical protein
VFLLKRTLLLELIRNLEIYPLTFLLTWCSTLFTVVILMTFQIHHLTPSPKIHHLNPMILIRCFNFPQSCLMICFPTFYYFEPPVYPCDYLWPRLMADFCFNLVYHFLVFDSIVVFDAIHVLIAICLSSIHQCIFLSILMSVFSITLRLIDSTNQPDTFYFPFLNFL